MLSGVHRVDCGCGEVSVHVPRQTFVLDGIGQMEGALVRKGVDRLEAVVGRQDGETSVVLIVHDVELTVDVRSIGPSCGIEEFHVLHRPSGPRGAEEVGEGFLGFPDGVVERNEMAVVIPGFGDRLGELLVV